MLKFLIPCCLLFLVPMVQAQSSLFVCKVGSELSKSAGGQKLQALQQAYKAIETLSAGFTQESSSQALGVSENSAGKVWFKKPGQMKWHYIEPEEQYFLVKENKFWFYQVALNQVLIDKLEQVLLSEVPLSFLLGMGNLSKDFKVDSACKNLRGIVLNLSPIAQSSAQDKNSLQKFQVLMSANNLPAAVNVIDSSGNATSVEFADLKSNPKIDSSVFALSLPQGVDQQDNSL